MESVYLLLADYANMTGDGKINVMGIFNRIFANNFPALHPEMYLVSQLSASPAEYDREFKLTIRLMDQDGKHVIVEHLLDGKIPRDEAGASVNVNTIIRLNNTLFPQPGAYGFYVLVDNDVKQNLSIALGPYRPA